MHLWKLAIFALLVLAAALFLTAPAATGQVTTPVTNLTITMNETGAIHYKLIQTVASNPDGAVSYSFELQKQYDPENVSVYDFSTGAPLQYTTRDVTSAIDYDVSFGRPYFDGYTFVVEYDNHYRIVDEGNGVYSLGYRPAVDINNVRRMTTVVLPARNVTYLNYNTALDKPVSVDTENGHTVIRFDNTTEGGDYAWEIRFKAVGISGEVRTPQTGAATMPPLAPPLGPVAAIIALAGGALLVRKKKVS